MPDVAFCKLVKKNHQFTLPRLAIVVVPYMHDSYLSCTIENKQGHVYYIAHDTLGILAFVDASETVPTFGASFEEVRGTIVNHCITSSATLNRQNMC